jgi:hypothetical protein
LGFLINLKKEAERMKEKRIVRKGLVIGMVLLMVFVVFAGMAGNVSADGGTVILHPGYIQGNLFVTGETVDHGRVDAVSIPPGYGVSDQDSLNGEYYLTVEGDYDYKIIAEPRIDELIPGYESRTHLRLKPQTTHVDVGETVNLNFHLDSGYIAPTVTVTGGQIDYIQWYAYTNYDPTDQITYFTNKFEYGGNVWDPDIGQYVFHYLSGSTVFPVMPWYNYDANSDGDTTDYWLGDKFFYVSAKVSINDIVYDLPFQYIDVDAGETVDVYWELDVTPGTISGSVNIVGESDPYWYLIRGNTDIGETHLSIADYYSPGTQDYYTEVPGATWEVYPDIRLYDPSTNLDNYLSLISIPDTLTIAPDEEVVHDWEIVPGYVTGSIDVWGANPDFYYAYIYADCPTTEFYPYNAYTGTSTNDYRLILHEGDWDIGLLYNVLSYDYDPSYRYLSYDTSFLRISDYGIHYVDPAITISPGETISDYDFSYGTATLTLNYEVEGGGELWDPSITAYSYDGIWPDRIDTYVNGHGSSEITTYGECTVTLLGGNTYDVYANAYVEDGSLTRFGHLSIDVEPGDVILHDIGAPVLEISEPTGFQHVPGRSVQVVGIATDDSSIASITVNGVGIEFTSTGNPDDPNEVSYSTLVGGLDYGENTITVVATDTYDKTSSVERTVISDLQNSPPEIISISGPGPMAVGTPVEMTGIYSDPDNGDTHTSAWDWGDGCEPTTGTAVDGTAIGSHIYDTPGVYTVSLTITDEADESDEMEYNYVVVYDPIGGFVTGGGWIDSPVGAYVPDSTLTGKANFGFVSKYKKGADTPTGNTEFQFKAGNLNFHSNVQEWLVIVVSGAKAQYKGTGTINGAGNFGFKLTAIDGELNGGGGIDKFRIKIWDKDTDLIVYDNLLGADDDADPTTILGGGQIKIHKI